MDLVWEAIGDAVALVLRADPELLRIAALSLVVSGAATAIAATIASRSRTASVPRVG